MKWWFTNEGCSFIALENKEAVSGSSLGVGLRMSSVINVQTVKCRGGQCYRLCLLNDSRGEPSLPSTVCHLRSTVRDKTSSALTPLAGSHDSSFSLLGYKCVWELPRWPACVFIWLLSGEEWPLELGREKHFHIIAHFRPYGSSNTVLALS